MSCAMQCEICPLAFTFRWVGRLLAVVALAIIAAFMLGISGMHLFQVNPQETILMVPFLTAALGLLIGLHRELLGGTLAVGSMLGFYWLDYRVSGSFPQGWTFAFIALPGVCFLAASFFDACKRRHEQCRTCSPPS
jgi:hypothetical protein